MAGLTEKEAYQSMLQLLLADEFMEHKLPLHMFQGFPNMSQKEEWISHICKEEGIDRNTWDQMIFTFLLMDYDSATFMNKFKKKEIINIPLEIQKAVSVYMKKKKWDETTG